MNILFINSIGPNKLGGGEKWMVRAAKGLHEAGHKVFVGGKPNAEILQEAQKAGVQTRIFNIRADIGPVMTWRIARFLKQEEIDILVCNLNKDVRVAGLAARLVKKPVVIARHGIQLAGKKWKHKITLTNLTDGILTNSITIQKAYEGYGWFKPGHVKVIYNGIADKSGVQAYDFSRDFPGKKVILSAGRLSEQKGFDDLITAFAAVTAKRDDLVLVIAGKGKLEEELKAQAKTLGVEDRVKFAGFIENVDPLMKGCHLFVLSSLFEGMPNVVMEAMAVGKPVIATDVNGARELMTDGVTGIIVPPKNPAVLAEKMLEILDDADRLAAFGKAGEQKVKAGFTIPAMVQQLETYFQLKLDEKRKVQS